MPQQTGLNVMDAIINEASWNISDQLQMEKSHRAPDPSVSAIAAARQVIWFG